VPIVRLIADRVRSPADAGCVIVLTLLATSSAGTALGGSAGSLRRNLEGIECHVNRVNQTGTAVTSSL
jgi:hypothetical protein